MDYPHGCRVMVPNDNMSGEVTVLTFNGAFDKRKLKRMLRKSLIGVSDPRILDALIKHCTQKLVPVTMEELISSMEANDDDTTEAETRTSGEGAQPPSGEAGS